MNREYDVIILGGVAGLYTAKALSKGGKSVALMKGFLGGTALGGGLAVKRALDYFKEKRER